MDELDFLPYSSSMALEMVDPFSLTLKVSYEVELEPKAQKKITGFPKLSENFSN